MHLDWQAYSEVVALRTAISEVLMTDLLWSQDATCPLTYFHLLNCYTHFHLSFGYLILLLLLRLAFDFCRRHVWWRLPFDSDLISDLINGWKLCDRRCRHPFIVRLESLAFGQFWQLNTFDASVMIWIVTHLFFLGWQLVALMIVVVALLLLVQLGELPVHFITSFRLQISPVWGKPFRLLTTMHYC